MRPLQLRANNDCILLGIDALHIFLAEKSSLDINNSGHDDEISADLIMYPAARKIKTLEFSKLETSILQFLSTPNPSSPSLLSILAPAPNSIKVYFANYFLLELRLDLASALFRLLEFFPALRLTQMLAGAPEPPPVKKAMALFFLKREAEAIKLLEDQQRTPAIIKLLNETGRFGYLNSFMPLLDLEA